MITTDLAFQAAICGLLSIIWDVAYSIFIFKTVGIGENEKREFWVCRTESLLHSAAFIVLLQQVPLQELAFWGVLIVGLILLYHQLDTIGSYKTTGQHIKKLFLTVIKKRQRELFDEYMLINTVVMVTFALLSAWEIVLIWLAVSFGRPL